MTVLIKKAVFDDCAEIHKMQVKSFTELLNKYKDYNTNPAAEPLETIEYKFKQDCTDYYFIMADNIKAGAARVVRINENTCRISPVFILPEYQNRGLAQQAILEIEAMYPNVIIWRLDTIKQENKLRHLYEKLGYNSTGKEEKIKEDMTITFYQKLK